MTTHSEYQRAQEGKKSNFASNALLLIKWFSTNNKYTQEVKIATINELNRQVKGLLEDKVKEELELVIKDAGILCMRPLLVDNMSKEGILSYFRYIMISPEVCQTYKKLNIPLLVSRILEKDSRDIVKGADGRSNRPVDGQIIQAIKFIKAWIQIAPKSVPKLLVSSLVAVAQMPVDDKQSKRECINIEQKVLAVDTIRILAINNPQMWNWSGGIAILVNAISDPCLAQRSQQIVYTLLYLLNQPRIRNNTHLFQDLNRIFWIFTDIDFNPDKSPQKNRPEDNGSNPFVKSKYTTQLDLCKKAVITLLKSWVGLIYLGNQMKTLRSFIESLRQKIRPEIRFAIYEILQSLLSIGNNSCRFKQSSQDLEISNLLNCYLITLVQLLIDCDLFKILVELSGLEDIETAHPAQKFLKQLTILMFNSLPDSSKYIDFLISAATHSGQGSIQLKSCSSYVINKIGNYLFDNKARQKPIRLISELQNMYVSSNLFIPLAKASLAETAYAINLLQEEYNHKNKNIDNIGLQRQNKHKYQKWKWERIEEILKNAYDTKTKLETGDNKFVQYLLRFYNPNQLQFVNLEWKIDNFKYLKVGQLFFKNLITLHSYIQMLKAPSKSQFEVTISFIEEIKLVLFDLLKSCETMTPLGFFHTMKREVICWFGLLSYTNQSYNELLIKYSIFQILDAYLRKPEYDYVISTLLFSFDYNRQNVLVRNDTGEEEFLGPRALLKNCIMRGSERLVMQALEVVRALYLTQIVDFQSWGFPLLARTLLEIAPESPVVMSNLMSILIKSFGEPQNTQQFVQKLDFEKLNGIITLVSPQFLIKLLSNQTGVQQILKHLMLWMETQFDLWLTTKGLDYNMQMQNTLKNALDFVHPKFQGYTMKEPGNYIETIYIYKLPWVAHIQNVYYPLMAVNKEYGFSISGVVHLPIPASGIVQFYLMIGAMYVDFRLNYSGEQKSKGVKIQLDIKDKTDQISTGLDEFNVTKEGVVFYFKKTFESQEEVLFLQKVDVQLKMRRSSQNSKLPTHLIGELAKTQAGVKYLKDKKAHILFMERIQSKQILPHQIRAALWSIGFLGSCSKGMTLLKEVKAVQVLIKMCFSHSHLSLRGTCRYILNMICASPEGRKQITEKGWLTNSHSSIGWICVPPVSKKFFVIQEIDPNYWPNCAPAWTAYSSALQPLSQKQKQLVKNISLMSNTLSSRAGHQNVKRILSNSPELRSSAKLFKNIILLITFYNFKLQTRRSIFMMFDDYIKSAKFMNDIQNAKFYTV